MGGHSGPANALLSPLHRAATQLWVGDPWNAQRADQTVVLVQRITGRATVKIDLKDIQLPGAGRCLEL